MGVGGDQPDPGEAAGDQVPEECRPAGTVHSGHHVWGQDLPVRVGVDSHGDQALDSDDPPPSATLSIRRRRSRRAREP